MKKYPIKTIGELCNIIKGETGIASAIPVVGVIHESPLPPQLFRIAIVRLSFWKCWMIIL